MAATEDIEKFLEVFVRFEKDGELIPYDPDYYDYALSHLYSFYFDGWVEYLRRKANRMGDDFYDWYDEMTFDSLDIKDLGSYRLPDEPIIMPVNNEVTFVNTVHRVLSDWYDGCNVANDDMATVILRFNKGIITASYAMFTGFRKDRAKADTIIDSFDDALKAVQKAIAQFNIAQGENGVHIETWAHPERARDVSNVAFIENDSNTLIRTELARSLAISTDDLFYSKSKKPASSDYIEKFFSIIEDDRNKGIDFSNKELSPAKYEEFLNNAREAKRAAKKSREPVTN